MRTYNIPVYYFYKPALLERSNGSPESRFATAWVLGDLGLLRKHPAVVSPQPEESQDDLSLAGGESKRSCQAIADQVVLFKQEAR